MENDMSAESDVSIDLVKEMLSYIPDTGEIYWAKSPSKNVYAGESAGCEKATRKDKDGNSVSYNYIRLNGQSIPSARIAWVLHHGEWPNGRVKFNDSNPLNLKAENLTLNKSLPKTYDFKAQEDRVSYYREHRKVYKTDYTDKDLQRKYGISLLEYSQIFMAQGGKCAICGTEDPGTRNGEKKAFAVDHCHTTGKVRGLLCEACNTGIGKLKEDVEILQGAIRYLNNHNPKGCE